MNLDIEETKGYFRDDGSARWIVDGKTARQWGFVDGHLETFFFIF